MRLAAGIGAAVIFPVTLSIIVNVFSDRKQRSIAIGVWAATSGLGIGIGPTFGGLLVEHYWWGSSLMLAGSIAVAALLATTMFVPDSRDPSTPPLDVIGLTLSTLGLGTLVYTLIEAPEHGWSSDHTVIGLAVALMVLIGFLLQERRCPHPMLDVMPSRRRGAESLPAVTGFVGGPHYHQFSHHSTKDLPPTTRPWMAFPAPFWVTTRDPRFAGVLRAESLFRKRSSSLSSSRSGSWLAPPRPKPGRDVRVSSAGGRKATAHGEKQPQGFIQAAPRKRAVQRQFPAFTTIDGKLRTVIKPGECHFPA